MLTHRNVVVTASHMAQGLNVSENDRLCAPIPLWQCFASIGGSIACALRGACLVPLETFRLFYTKAGKIVAHEGLTSRLPDRVLVFDPKQRARQLFGRS